MKSNDLKALKEKIIFFIAVVTSLFHIYMGYFGTRDVTYFRATHLLLMLILTFLIYPAFEKKLHFWLIDIFLIIISFIPYLYLILNTKEIAYTLGLYTNTRLLLGIVLIILVLEATRRLAGLSFPALAVFFIIYARFGSYFGPLSHKPYSWQRIMEQLYLSTEGIFGVPLGVVASYVVLLMIFSAFLEKFEAEKFFLDFSMSIGGKRRSGPALANIIGGYIFGMISGSAVANVAATGNFTIPLMKKVGYKPEVAGAISALSGTGGQIAPPVMGAAAFILAQLVGVTYLTVVKRAFIPAFLYYFVLFCFVEFYSEKEKIKLIPTIEIPKFKEIFGKHFYTFIIPIVLLFYLLFRGENINTAVILSIISILITVFFIEKIWKRGVLKIIFPSILKALKDGSIQTLTVSLTCACAGIIIGMVGLTGLGLRMSSVIIGLSGGNLFITLFAVMVACLIMGMGLPTSAAYIIVAILGGPALMDLGVPLISAHLFIFYFAVISNITPPVCLAAYASAAIAGSSPMRTGLKASIYGIGLYIIPYFFIYRPSIMCLGNIFEVFTTIIFIAGGIFCAYVSIIGYMMRKHLNIFERFTYLVLTILMFQCINIWYNFIGLIVFLVLFFYFHFNRNKIIKE